MSKKLVVFVCTANICRSPMAEFLFRRHLASSTEWQTCSAGLMARHGIPASRHAVKAMKEMAIDLRPHRSQPITRELVDDASLIVAMTAAHRDELCERFPDAETRTALLKAFDPASDGCDVLDPTGLPLDIHRRVRDEIAAALWGLDAHLSRIEQIPSLRPTTGNQDGA